MNRPTTLADYLAILRRHLWLIILPAVIAGLVAYVAAKRQSVSYRASAVVLVNRSAGVVSGITAGQDPATGDSVRFLNTQASIARTPALVTRVVATAGVPGVTADGLLHSSSVTPATDADLLTVSVSARHPQDAVTLANAYASGFSQYKTQLDTAQINAALNILRARTTALANAGQTASTDYQALFQYQAQLETIRGLGANITRVIQPAQRASATGARPLRDLVLGVLIGGFAGIALAFLVDSLDQRVRKEEEIEAALGLPLLGRLPRPPRRLRSGHGLVLLSEPAGAQAQAFRRLRTRLELVNSDRRATTIMFTSAAPGEGKSTTVANLAIAFARAGRRVALVDLDLRSPSLHNLLRVTADQGITDVAVNDVRLKSALQQIALSPPADSSNGRPLEDGSTDGRTDVQGALYLLPCGTTPALDSEVLESAGLAAALEELDEIFDVILIDGPPFLTGDAMSLSTKVDAIVVVAKLGLRRPLLKELASELPNAPAPRLGLVLTGVERADGSAYPDGADRESAPAKGARGKQPV